MKWVLRDSATNFYVARDLFDERGVVFCTSINRAARFSTIAAARDTVLQICNATKKTGKRVILRIDPVSELSRRNSAAYFRSKRA
jgi:pyridoxine/pyridoxamine 5'-phosphate oxidase